MMKLSDKNLITLKIVVISPPTGVDYALQKGSGNDYECVQTQRATGGNLEFNCEIVLKKSKDSLDDFAGPFVNGKAGERFLYLDIGAAARQFGSAWSRRLKIPLTGINSEMLDSIKLQPTKFLYTEVEGTAKDGTPTCATVKPFQGWRVS